MELNDLLKLSFKKPDKVGKLLDKWLTHHPGGKGVSRRPVLTISRCAKWGRRPTSSPRGFSRASSCRYLKKVFEKITVPSAPYMRQDERYRPSMVESGATAISVDQKNDVAETRRNSAPRRSSSATMIPTMCWLRARPSWCVRRSRNAWTTA